MPAGRPHPLGPVSVPEVVAALYQLHDRADDPYKDRFPAPEDIVGVLTYTARHVSALRDPEARAESTRLRLLLVRQLRQALDSHELKAIRDGREVKVGKRQVLSWATLAPMMGVDSRNGALLRAQRLEAAAELEPGERRTPEALRQRRREAQRVAERHEELVRALMRLLRARTALLTDPDIDEDLDDIAGLLGVRKPTARQRASLAARTRLVLREVEALAAERGRPEAGTPEAERLLRRVRDLTAN
ncbi:hypothetical protein [Streptomyces sp. NPDC002851]